MVTEVEVFSALAKFSHWSSLIQPGSETDTVTFRVRDENTFKVTQSQLPSQSGIYNMPELGQTYEQPDATVISRNISRHHTINKNLSQP